MPEPIFKVCVRCGYSLRGLPANHACPECGLRFDEACELYRVSNPRQLLLVWLVIFTGGWIVLKNLRHLSNFGATSGWQKLGVIAAFAWFIFVGLGVWFLVKRYRQGFDVAITTDGLIVHLPGFDDELIPWINIGGASHRPVPGGRPQIATVFIKSKRKDVAIGGVANVFPTVGHVKRFVEQVNKRSESAASHEAGTNRCERK